MNRNRMLMLNTIKKYKMKNIKGKLKSNQGHKIKENNKEFGTLMLVTIGKNETYRKFRYLWPKSKRFEVPKIGLRSGLRRNQVPQQTTPIRPNLTFPCPNVMLGSSISILYFCFFFLFQTYIIKKK